MTTGFVVGFGSSSMARRVVLGSSVRRSRQLFTSAMRMSVVDDVSNDMKSAMKAKEAAKLKALRNMRAAFLTKMKETGVDSMSDEDAIAVLRRLAKQRQESIDMYEKGGRTDLVDEEKSELAIIDSYLPKLADEATTRSWVEAAVKSSGATSPKEIGKVMGAVMKEHKGEVDGNLVRKLAAEFLS